MKVSREGGKRVAHFIFPKGNILLTPAPCPQPKRRSRASVHRNVNPVPHERYHRPHLRSLYRRLRLCRCRIDCRVRVSGLPSAAIEPELFNYHLLSAIFYA